MEVADQRHQVIRSREPWPRLQTPPPDAGLNRNGMVLLNCAAKASRGISTALHGLALLFAVTLVLVRLAPRNTPVVS